VRASSGSVSLPETPSAKWCDSSKPFDLHWQNNAAAFS
jgi:hypothetical protein